MTAREYKNPLFVSGDNDNPLYGFVTWYLNYDAEKDAFFFEPSVNNVVKDEEGNIRVNPFIRAERDLKENGHLFIPSTIKIKMINTDIDLPLDIYLEDLWKTRAGDFSARPEHAPKEKPWTAQEKGLIHLISNPRHQEVFCEDNVVYRCNFTSKKIIQVFAGQEKAMMHVNGDEKACNDKEISLHFPEGITGFKDKSVYPADHVMSAAITEFGDKLKLYHKLSYEYRPPEAPKVLLVKKEAEKVVVRFMSNIYSLFRYTDFSQCNMKVSFQNDTPVEVIKRLWNKNSNLSITIMYELEGDKVVVKDETARLEIEDIPIPL